MRLSTSRLLWASLLIVGRLTSVQGADDGIDLRSNVIYSQNRHCSFDLAVPQSPNGLRPGVVVIHGGGWVEGDKASFATAEHGTPGNIVEFAELGFVAAAINYRLSGDAPFPAALDDCRDAIRFLRAHAREYRLDPTRIGVYGNSAGGHLALLLALMDDPAEAKSNDNRKPSSRVQAAASDSGPVDLVRQFEENRLREVVTKFMGGSPEGERLSSYRRASPISYVAHRKEPAPPLLLIYGETDEQVDVRTADLLVGALAKAGQKDITYIRLANVGHCPHSMLHVPYTKTIVNEFFTRTLRQQ
ncbi:MAG TPA: alpha/beta hydrolase [Pirellulales bacterium]|nr:alpha/beta hydrolase [Pirellulales bacterium]